MRILRNLALALLFAAVALAGLAVAMSERVEVVVLHSHDARGEHETRLWVVDDGGWAWLRTGLDNASWLPRLRANPAVELDRGDETLACTAAVVTDAQTLARVNQLMLEKYGWSERVLRVFGDEPARQVAIRLDPR